MIPPGLEIASFCGNAVVAVAPKSGEVILAFLFNRKDTTPFMITSTEIESTTKEEAYSSKWSTPPTGPSHNTHLSLPEPNFGPYCFKKQCFFTSLSRARAITSTVHVA